jgi:hypothetical protein
MEWKIEFEQLREKLELFDYACMEPDEAVEITEALKTESQSKPYEYA